MYIEKYKIYMVLFCFYIKKFYNFWKNYIVNFKGKLFRSSILVIKEGNSNIK